MAKHITTAQFRVILITYVFAKTNCSFKDNKVEQ